MSFFGLSRGRSKKVSSNGDLSFDLLYQLIYLSSIAAAGLPRNQIFGLAAKLPCSTSRYFKEVDSLARSMNYQYAEACRLVGESAKKEEVKSLLLRLSSSLTTGEPATEFLNREAHIQAESYGNAYEGKLESLKKWSDAYIALVVSTALIIVVSAISTVIYNMGIGFVMGLVVVMGAISGLGCWVIYRMAPRDAKTMAGPADDRGQRLTRRLFTILVPAAMVTGAVILAAGLPIGWVLAVGGGMLVPIGVASWRFDMGVSQRDNDISTFLRVLGATASAIGATPVQALGRMDLRAMGSLAPAVRELHIRLRARVSPQLCWRQFARGTGSELINRGVRVFLDGISLGGEAEEVGARASLLTMKVNFLRAKRKLVSATFGWLALAMHAAIIFLLVFIIEIVDGFGAMVGAAGLADEASGGVGSMSSMLSFNFESMAFLRQLIIMVAIFLSVINAITIKVTEGGYSHNLFYYLGVTLFTSGMGLLVAPKLAATIFGIAPAQF